MRLALAFLVLISVGLRAEQPVEHLSPYGLARPVLIAVGELPTDFENKDNIAVIDARHGSPPAGFAFLDKATDDPKAGVIGIHVPTGAVLKIQGRKMSNAGSGVVTLRLVKSERRPARSVELEGKKTADYNELRRCAFERAVGSPYPPEKPDDPVVPKGTLVIIGGGGTTSEINKAFLEAGGGPDGHFVVLPVSMPDPIKVENEERFLRRLGAKNITVLPQREQKDLETPEVVAALKKATGLWFGGGRQWNFMDAYEGTKLPGLFREVLERGGVVGGSSAGATIQGDYLVRGAPAGPQIMMCEGYERGLDFLPGVAIDQHFSARNRFKDMSALMLKYPQFLGIGLDEATAIVVRGSTAEVLGKGKVHFYDRRKPIKDGEPDYEALPAGAKYDLKARKKIEEKKTEQ
jgi:cyanophycinase